MVKWGPGLQAITRKTVGRESPGRWKPQSFYSPVVDMVFIIFGVFYLLEIRGENYTRTGGPGGRDPWEQLCKLPTSALSELPHL